MYFTGCSTAMKTASMTIVINAKDRPADRYVDKITILHLAGLKIFKRNLQSYKEKRNNFVSFALLKARNFRAE